MTLVTTRCVFQGDDMLHEIYYNIGVVEVCYFSYDIKLIPTHRVLTFFCVKVQDQIDVTKQLVDLYPFIDKSRVGSTLVCLFSTPCEPTPGCHLGLELRWFRDRLRPRCRC